MTVLIWFKRWSYSATRHQWDATEANNFLGKSVPGNNFSKPNRLSKIRAVVMLPPPEASKADRFECAAQTKIKNRNEIILCDRLNPDI